MKDNESLYHEYRVWRMYALLLMKDNESLYQAFEKSCLDKPPYLNKEQSIHISHPHHPQMVTSYDGMEHIIFVNYISIHYSSLHSRLQCGLCFSIVVRRLVSQPVK